MIISNTAFTSAAVTGICGNVFKLSFRVPLSLTTSEKSYYVEFIFSN